MKNLAIRIGCCAAGFLLIRSRMQSCCGGELLLHLPGLGVIHVPTSRKSVQRFSIAGPLVTVVYLVMWLLLVLFLRACSSARSRRHRCSLATAITVIAAPALFRSAFGEWVTLHYQLSSRFASAEAAASFASALRDYRGHEIFDKAPTVGQMDEELAARAARWVDEHRQLWTVHPASKGAPHFHLGYRYETGWHGGSMHSANSAHSQKVYHDMWRGLGDVYDGIKDALEAITSKRAQLHRELNPPGILINMPFAEFRDGEKSPEVHEDCNLARVDTHSMRELLHILGPPPPPPPPPVEANADDADDGAASSDPFGDDHHDEFQCDWHAQSTLTVALKTPPTGQTGLQLWRYGNVSDACPADGFADASCITRELVPYRPGSLVLFPSMRSHATGHGYQPMFSVDERMIVVAFVIPCGHGSDEVLHILPTVLSRASKAFEFELDFLDKLSDGPSK